MSTRGPAFLVGGAGRLSGRRGRRQVPALLVEPWQLRAIAVAHDAESLAFFLSRAEYAAAFPILEGRLGRFHRLLLAG